MLGSYANGHVKLVILNFCLSINVDLRKRGNGDRERRVGDPEFSPSCHRRASIHRQPQGGLRLQPGVLYVEGNLVSGKTSM